jgi:erythrocyte band 7 integral membrane protein
MAREPMALQLRYLQTLFTISAEKNSTIIFPIPIEFMGMISGMSRPSSVGRAKPTDEA